MKQEMRNKLFEKIAAAMAASTGKQRDIAAALGITQKDVSVIKLGRVEMFSTDKLIDIAEKCGWTFSFKVVKGDSALMDSALSREKAIIKAELDAIDFGAM